MPDPLLRVHDLRTYFYTEGGVAKAVDGVSFDIGAGETVGLVGESGCGKSVTALSLLRLIRPPGRIETGSDIEFDGRNLVTLDEKSMREIRGARMSMVFQEPMTALNPVFKIGDQIAEVVRVHDGGTKREARERAIKMLETVGFASAAERVDDYPHQLSGGMRQRVMIAMALACNPKLLIADEPTTALDVTIQAQILELLDELRKQRDLAVLLITHDLGVVAEVADRVAVMYTGRIVEESPVEELFERPKHPYTEGLLRSVPKLTSEHVIKNERLQTIEGTVPRPTDLPPGCHFAPRCSYRMPRCTEEDIPLYELDGDVRVRCVLYDLASAVAADHKVDQDAHL